MRLNYHEHYRPCHDVVFAVLFGKRKLFCPLVSAVTGEDIEINGDPHTQASLREDDVLLNSIRFDTFAQAKNNKFYTADIQRSYKEARLYRRTVYYACRAISTQTVASMAYEDLNPVNISFMLTGHDEPHPIRHVKLCDIHTNEVFDDLLEITLVYVLAVIREGDRSSNLYIFARFFAISSQDEANQFVDEFYATDIGKELILMYNKVVTNVQGLQKFESLPYFSGRLTEAQLEEERKKAEKKGELIGIQKGKKEIVMGMLNEKMPIDLITKITKVPRNEIETWVIQKDYYESKTQMKREV